MSIATTATATARTGFARQLGALVHPKQGLLTGIVLLVLTGALFELLPPMLVRSIVDDHLAVGKREGLLALAVLYLAAIALGQGLAFVYGYHYGIADFLMFGQSSFDFS